MGTSEARRLHPKRWICAVDERRGLGALASHAARRGTGRLDLWRTVAGCDLDALLLRSPLTDARALRELQPLALALGCAVGRVPARRRSKREIDARVRAISEPRRLTLAYLEIAAALGRVPRGRVAAIREGKGKLDMAKDCVMIHGMFEEFADALGGHSLFSEEYLSAMSSDGTWLMGALKSGRLKRVAEPRTPESIERDQFARLLEEGHAALRVAGAVLFGVRDLDARVPPLQSARRRAARKRGDASTG